MLDHDDADEFIADIIEDLAGQVNDKIYVDYISRQLIPYTVLQAREAIVQIIQVCTNYMAHNISQKQKHTTEND